MAFALPSLVTGALLATGVTLSPVQVGAYSDHGLKLTSPIVGAFSSTGLKLTSPIVGAYQSTGVLLPLIQTGGITSSRDIRLPLLLTGDYRNEVTGSRTVTGSTALVQMVSNPVIIGAAVTTSPTLAAWNPNALATSSAAGTSIAMPGQAIFIGVTSTGAFVSKGSSPTIFWEVVTSSSVGSSASAAQRVIQATVTGTAIVNGAIVGSARYQVGASSVAQIISGIQFVQDFWDGWAFNLNTAAPSSYEDFKFNSFARIGAKYYGCNGTGIHLLGGDLDGAAKINATITTGTSDLTVSKVFDGSSIKSVPYAYISAKSPEAMTLTCRVEGQEYAYTFRAGKDVVAPSRVDIGKGLRGTFWQFELANKNGADFEIDSLSVMPVSTTRRI